MDGEDRSDAQRVFGSFVSLGGGEILARIVAFLGTAYLTRRLGASGFGILTFATAICGYFTVAVTAGFESIGAREIARRPQEARAIARSIVLVRLGLATVALIIVTFVAAFLNKPAIVKLTVALTGFTFLSLAMDTAFVYKGLEKNRLVGFSIVLRESLNVVAILLVVRGIDDIARVPLAQVFGQLSAALVLAIPLVRMKRGVPHTRAGLRILRASGPLTVTRLLRTVIHTFSVVILAYFVEERVVGLYAAAYRFCFLAMAINVAVHFSYLPVIVRATRRGEDDVSDLVGRSVELATAIGAPIIFGAGVLAGPLLSALFGVEYAEGAGPFRLLLLSVGFAFVQGSFHNVLLAYVRTGVEMRIVAVGAGLNVGLNVLLIPHFGLTGAAAAVVAGEAAQLMLMFVVVYRLGVRPEFRWALRPLLAAVAMGAFLMFWGHGGPLVVPLAAGGVVYAVTLVALGGVPRDAQWHLRRLFWLARNLIRGLSGR